MLIGRYNTWCKSAIPFQFVLPGYHMDIQLVVFAMFDLTRKRAKFSVKLAGFISFVTCRSNVQISKRGIYYIKKSHSLFSHPFIQTPDPFQTYHKTHLSYLFITVSLQQLPQHVYLIYIQVTVAF